MRTFTKVKVSVAYKNHCRIKENEKMKEVEKFRKFGPSFRNQ